MLRVKEQRVKGVVIEGVGPFQIVASVFFWQPGIPLSCPLEGKPPEDRRLPGEEAQRFKA
jgi:hypothetical protein